MWYAFWPEAVSTEEKFMSQMDALVREVGDRGKVTTQLSEGVPPFVAQLSEAPAAFEPHPEPAPEPARAPAPAQARMSEPTRTVAPTTPAWNAAVATPTEAGNFTPNMHQMHMSPSMPVPTSMHPSVESMGIVQRLLDDAKSERAILLAAMEQQRAEMAAQARADKEEMAAHVKADKVAMEAKLAEMEAKLAPADAVSDEQMQKLQERVEQLHGQKLITDVELFAVEDLCADFIELESCVGKLSTDTVLSHHLGADACKLMALSEKLPSNAVRKRAFQPLQSR